MGWLRVWGEGDVVELTQAKPLAVHRHAKVAEINGLPCSLCDLVCGRSRGFALWRQIRHDDSADARQSQHHWGGLKRVRQLLLQIIKEITAKNHRVKKGAAEGMKSSIKTSGRQGQDDRGLTQLSAGVKKQPSPSSHASSSLLGNYWGKYAAVLGKGFPLHPSSSSSSWYSFCADLETVGGWCHLKCKREGYWKIPAVPQPAFALLRSDWAARAPQWMCWLGGCWPRWPTAALGTAIHCHHVSRWCMRKMQGGLGRGPRGACLMLMMQQRTHQRCYWPETQACVVCNEETAVTNPDLL